MRRPISSGNCANQRASLPRALFLGTGIVIALYVALNAVFLLTTPINELAGRIDVALIAGTHVFGNWADASSAR